MRGEGKEGGIGVREESFLAVQVGKHAIFKMGRTNESTITSGLPVGSLHPDHPIPTPLFICRKPEYPDICSSISTAIAAMGDTTASHVVLGKCPEGVIVLLSPSFGPLNCLEEEAGAVQVEGILWVSLSLVVLHLVPRQHGTASEEGQ